MREKTDKFSPPTRNKSLKPNGTVTQLVEYRPFKARVEGSSPSDSTNYRTVIK